MIHPNQTNVDWPSNVNDDAVPSAGNYAQPLSVPADMTYLICRIEVAGAFREIVDAAATAGCELDDVPYELVLEFDPKLHGYLDSVPYFFRPDPKSRMQSKAIDQATPYIALQRKMRCFRLHTQLSQLHRPYLARGSSSPK